MTTPAEDLEALLQRIPYAQFLGVRAELAGDEMTAILPFGPHLVGNPIPLTEVRHETAEQVTFCLVHVSAVVRVAGPRE